LKKLYVMKFEKSNSKISKFGKSKFENINVPRDIMKFEKSNSEISNFENS